jgi:hypothetical protein
MNLKATAAKVLLHIQHNPFSSLLDAIINLLFSVLASVAGLHFRTYLGSKIMISFRFVYAVYTVTCSRPS